MSVSITVGAYGVAFGAAAVANGFTVVQACLLSLLTFSGASQFAVIGVIGAGGSAISAIATASLLGVRNALYGVIMAPRLQVKGFKRVLAAQITIDESTGVALGQEPYGIEAINTFISEINRMTNERRNEFIFDKRLIRFNDGAFMWGYKGLNFFDIRNKQLTEKLITGQTHCNDYEEKWWDFEIIGNIYENPELLENE